MSATGDRHIRVHVLGTRGSIPVSGAGYAEFGGSSSCYLVEAGDERIFLDAGSGLMHAAADYPGTPVILLSHLHVDHLLGLGMYERLSRPGAVTRLYVPARDANAAREAIERLYGPPLWPLQLSSYKGDLRIAALPERLRIGEVSVETERGSHPGGVTLIKISFAGKVVVYATDFEHDPETSARLVEFARGANLLLYDGQYGDDEYESHRGFGHSTPSEGVAVMERAGVGQLLIVHHDPHSTDQVLLERERALGRDNVRFAREGETIEL